MVERTRQENATSTNGANSNFQCTPAMKNYFVRMNRISCVRGNALVLCLRLSLSGGRFAVIVQWQANWKSGTPTHTIASCIVAGLSCHTHFTLAYNIFQCNSLLTRFGLISGLSVVCLYYIRVCVWCYFIVNFHISSIFIHFDRLKALTGWLNVMNCVPALCAFSPKPCCVYIIVYAGVFFWIPNTMQLFVGVFPCLCVPNTGRSFVLCLFFGFSLDAHFSDFSLSCVHFVCGWDSISFFPLFLFISLCAVVMVAFCVPLSVWLYFHFGCAWLNFRNPMRFSSFPTVCAVYRVHVWMPAA